MTIGELIAPEGDDELFDCEEEALALKPVMTGDIFVGVTVPGEPHPVNVMVAGARPVSTLAASAVPVVGTLNVILPLPMLLTFTAAVAMPRLQSSWARNTTF